MYKEIFKNYFPTCEQEQVDKETINSFIFRNEDVLFRKNKIAHITSSAIIVNKDMDKVLFVHHNLYNSWSWVGGHNDGDPDLLKVAIKEAKEETGLVNVEAYSNEVIAVDIIHVDNHIKKASFVGDHLHLNATYLLIADEDDKLIVKEDENSDVKWFYINEVLEHVNEVRIKNVYKKIFKEIEILRKR